MDNDFVKKWMALWDPTVKWNNVFVKSPEQLCKSRLIKFKELYPNISDETILQATQNYLLERKNNNWEYTMRSHFFIEKKGSPSRLKQYCDNIGEKKLVLDINKKFFNDFI